MYTPQLSTLITTLTKLAAGAGMKSALGLFLLVIGLLIISGADKTFETFLVDVSPEWLTSLTTRF
jgi:hypothetical protein